MNIIQRIKQLSDKEGITITYLEKKISASKGVLSRALKNNTDIQTKWIIAIVENYPQYDTTWLLTGKGEMLLDNNEESITGEPAAVYKASPLVQEKEPPQFVLLKKEIKLLEEKVKDKEKIISLQEEKITKDTVEIKELREKNKLLKELLEKKNLHTKPVGVSDPLPDKLPTDKPRITPLQSNIKKQKRTRK